MSSLEAPPPTAPASGAGADDLTPVPTTAHGAATAVTEANHISDSTDTTSSGAGGVLKSWRTRLMNWRSGGSAATVADTSEESVPAPCTGDGATAETTSAEVAPTQTAASAEPAAAAAAARPMNIWLRRALERQAETAIAQAIHDGKPVPDAATLAAPPALATTTAAAATEHEPAAKKGIADAEATLAGSSSAPKTSFAELMRQHREGLLPPAVQPPVKATKVVKKPKATPEPAAATKAVAKEKAKPARTAGSEAPENDTAETAAPDAAVATKEEGSAADAAADTTKEAATGKAAEAPITAAAPAIHQAAVRKRTKAAASPTAATTASARRPREAKNATPTHTVTVKGPVSLEELRAWRNRTTAAASASSSAHHTPVQAGAAHNGANGDAYNEGALEGISQLLLRYCLGDQAASPVTTELEFLNQLMELREKNSITPESLELLGELFQHVRVLPRPTVAGTTAAAVSSSPPTDPTSDTTATEVGEKDGDATAATPTVGIPDAAATAAAQEAYREVSRRREYVQQVIMVLINRLKQLKISEQQRQQQQQDETGAAGVSAPPVTGSSTMPSIKVGGVPLAPLTQAEATAPPQSTAGPSAVSYKEQTRRLAQWRALTELAQRSSSDSEAVAAAALTAATHGYGAPNPYAHLTVFSQQQPVAPPVGFVSAHAATARRGRGGQQGPSHGTDSGHNVASRLVASPFPGAFPILPPPSSAGLRGANAANAAADEDREMQELFQLIRTQLSQPPAHKASEHGSDSDGVSRVSSVANLAPVEVSQAERAVLRHVQEDFKQRMGEQQQQQRSESPAAKGSAAPSSPPSASTSSPPPPQPQPIASTPPSASLKVSAATPPPAANRTVFTPQTKSQPQNSGDVITSGHAAKPFAATTLNVAARPFVPTTAAPAPGVTVAAAATTPAKTTFNYTAKPFVPGGVLNGEPSPAASTPPHTTFNFAAKPFVPSAAASSGSDAVAAQPAASVTKISYMNPTARDFVPPAWTSQPSSSPPPRQSTHTQPSHNTLAGPFGAPPGPTPDTWASYEMFTYWRDMMEAYYQGVFSAQHPGGGGSGAPSAINTPPRPY